MLLCLFIFDEKLLIKQNNNYLPNIPTVRKVLKYLIIEILLRVPKYFFIFIFS